MDYSLLFCVEYNPEYVSRNQTNFKLIDNKWTEIETEKGDLNYDSVDVKNKIMSDFLKIMAAKPKDELKEKIKVLER